MRYKDIIVEQKQPYRYIGNCTNYKLSPHLESMIDSSREISYPAFVRAVGRENLKGLFPDYNWSRSPGGLRMKDDHAVSYHRSTYDGHPAYYVRHSGIEYVFVPTQYDEPRKSKSSNAHTVTHDGNYVRGNRSGVMTLTPEGRNLHVNIMTAPTDAAARTAIEKITQGGYREIIDSDGDKEPAREFLDWLRRFVR